MELNGKIKTNKVLSGSLIRSTGGGGGAVDSVNGKTGVVVLDAQDVGALPASTVIPTKTSDLTNDIGFITASGAPVQSVNGQTGAVTVSGLSQEAKQALMDCFANTAWAVNNGQAYYDALASALGLQVLSSITAVFTQGSATIYDTDSLDTLKQYLVVTATYSDSTTATVTDYTLSGTLTDGTSTITVSYGGKTDTFNVSVTVDRDAVFGTFVDGFTSVKVTESAAYPAYTPFIYRQAASGRATSFKPIANNNYVFTVTDSTKYNLAIYDCTSNTELQIPNYGAANPKIGYSAGNKTVGWAASGSVSTSYAIISLKKMDNTSFTSEELANGAEAVFTYTTA